MPFNYATLLNENDRIETLIPGQVIFEMGQPGHVMYVIKSGQAEIRVGDRIFFSIGQGDIFGEMALLDDSTRSASAVAITHCEVVAICKSRLLDMVQKQPHVALEMTRTMVRRLRAMNHKAQYDPLTQLPNRTLFHQQCRNALLRAAHQGRSIGVLHLDLDNFENINDSLGYSTADQVLVQVARRLQITLSEIDTLARLGADEFAILVESANEQSELEEISQALLNTLARPFDIGNQSIYLTASIGITRHQGEGHEAEALLKNADIAMHAAKDAGRNRYAVFSETLNTSAVEFLTFKSALRAALERKELSLHYQPRVDLRTGAVLSAEALMRWNHPDMGNVPPIRFIPVAEETGLIDALGEWALFEGCRQQKAWLDAGIAPGHIAINLSAKQMAQPDLVDMINDTLAETGLPPDQLELEITESALMADPSDVAEKLHALREMGIAIALDDFGTGYSSLSYLKRFPLDYMKIDQSFVRGIPGDSDDVAITRTIVALARNLRLKTVVEGVEAEEQLAFAQNEGCDEFQGYWFSKPLPADEMEALLRRPHA
ncbi:MAG TPA: EAL domain-containing protein [Rhodocyclaceae bacterium]|nr:EAL domain-containing protein [Rhodocyclaceae bacterium]